MSAGARLRQVRFKNCKKLKLQYTGVMRWLEEKRKLWAMDLFHWAIQMCPESWKSEFYDYVREVANAYARIQSYKKVGGGNHE